MYDIETLPQFYLADDGARIERPVYLLLADCFLGKPGGPPSYWETGTELETDLVPNEHMRPLNRAAGKVFNEWERSLPPAFAAITPQDLLEAAGVERQVTGQEEVPYEIWRGRVYDRAVEMKAQREGRRAPNAPRPHVMVPIDGKSPPPMTGANFKEMSHRDNSITGMTAHPQIAGKRVRRAVPAMATEPRPPAGDAVNQG